MPNTDPIFRPSAVQLIEMVRKLERRIRVLETSEGIFDINNENTPATLAADQNNYDPGNYDILRISSSLAISITGISGGVKGRRLQLFNVGSYAITLSNLSASSTVTNRFNFVNASDFVIPPNGTALLYYDSTQDYWIGGDMSSIYDVVNENTPTQLTANQNNYDIGLYEVLRLSSDAARTITGISGGVKGRSLRIFNVGSYAITLSHQSASSTAANRIISQTGFDIILLPDGEVNLYYDSTQSRWLSSYSSASDRISCDLRLSANQSIPDANYTALIWGTVAIDTGGFFNAGSPTLITIPEDGWYFLQTTVIYATNGTNLRETYMANVGGTIGRTWDSRLAVSNAQTVVSINNLTFLAAGEQYRIRVWQNSGGALDVMKERVPTDPLVTRFVVVKV